MSEYATFDAEHTFMQDSKDKVAAEQKLMTDEKIGIDLENQGKSELLTKIESDCEHVRITLASIEAKLDKLLSTNNRNLSFSFN